MFKRFIPIIFLALFLVLTISFSLAQNPLDGFVGQIDDATKKIEETEDKVQRLTREDYKWQELGKAWQEILLKNPVVAKFDEIFTKGNIVFVVLFGRDYAFSLTLFFLIILWLYFWSQFDKIIGTFSTFSSGTSMVISLGMTVILAQMQFFDWASQIIFKLVFYREGIWGLVWSVGLFFVVLMTAMICSRFLTSFKNLFKEILEKRKKAAREMEEEMHLSKIRIFSGALTEAFVQSAAGDGEPKSVWFWIFIFLILIGFILGIHAFFSL